MDIVVSALLRPIYTICFAYIMQSRRYVYRYVFYICFQLISILFPAITHINMCYRNGRTRHFPLILMAAAYRQYLRNKRKRRESWTKQWILRRQKHGAHRALMVGLFVCILFWNMLGKTHSINLFRFEIALLAFLAVHLITLVHQFSFSRHFSSFVFVYSCMESIYNSYL